jgi:hypothetical protein
MRNSRSGRWNADGGTGATILSAEDNRPKLRVVPND